MIQFPITDEMILAAEREADEYRDQLTNSITNGVGTTAGVVSEHHFKTMFPAATRVQSYSHDLSYRGYRIEVKTKRRTVDPRPHYLAAVSKTSTHQTLPNTIYVFYSLNTRTNVGTVCGMVHAEDFYRRAKFYNINDDMDGLPARAACWAMPYGGMYEVVDSNFIGDFGYAPVTSFVGSVFIKDGDV
jgi:hypothetical protein